ncbi:MAG: hypothetical protein IIZ93_00645 [Acidaminococcaceae bacterium]|nr:hypothetical protein [Acidaminococcaceae bacterium]
MMNDKRDVIDWLNDVAEDKDWTMYYSESERQMLAKDALSLLKAHEPRVMTLDEVKKLPTETDVWIQHAGKFADDVIRAATVSEVTNASISFWFGGSLYYMNYGEKPYGWICWTSRPTDEQRREAAWG